MKKVAAASVAIICPTKNQTRKIARLLQSIASQTALPGQVIVCEAGSLNRELEETFREKFCLLYLKSPVAGQVLQRNYGYKFLNDTIEIVLNLDDDVTLAPDAVEQLVGFWNSYEKGVQSRLGGVGLNVIDATPFKQNFLRKLFLMGSGPGKVDLSGYSAGFMPVGQSLNPEWLLGGSTSWRREVIEKFVHPIDFTTRWAFCEDVMFSYLVGKNYGLAVAIDAKLRHNETYSDMSFKTALYYGRSMVIMRYFFVTSNSELSIFAFFWMSIMQNASYLFLGAVGNRRYFGFGVGGFRALLSCLLSSLGYCSAKQLAVGLNEE